MGATTVKDGVLYHKLTKELYAQHKKDGWNDQRVMRRYGFNSQSLNIWKNENLSDEERAKHRLRRGAPAKTLEQVTGKKMLQEKNVPAVTATDVKESFKSSESAPVEESAVNYEDQYRRLYMEYRQLAEANEELKKEVNHLHSACEDLENGNASFEEIERLQKQNAHLLSLLDDRLTKDVLANVEEERRRQNKLWGKQRHDYSYWLTILIEEIGEVAQAIQKGSVASKASDAGDLFKELVQTAAVAVAIAEQVAEGGWQNG